MLDVRAYAVQEGLEKGRLEEKRSIAQKMKSQGLALDLIADYTGLSVEKSKNCKFKGESGRIHSPDINSAKK